MALPTSRDMTFTPNSVVPSAVLNDTQDAIVDHETRIVGAQAAIGAVQAAIADHESRIVGVPGQVFDWTAQQTFDLAPIAPDFRFTTSRHRMFSALAGHPYDNGGDWAQFTTGVQNTGQPATFVVPITVESGEVITVYANFKHAAATAGRITASLIRVAADGTGTTVVTAYSVASSAAQSLLVALAHTVVADCAYYVSFGNDVVSDTRDIYSVKVLVNR